MDVQAREAADRRRLRDVRRAGRSEGRHHQQRRRLQRGVRSEDAAVRQRRRGRYAASRTRTSARSRRSRPNTSRASRSPAWTAFPKWALLEGAHVRAGRRTSASSTPSNPISGKEPLLVYRRRSDHQVHHHAQPDVRSDAVRAEEVGKDVARAASMMDVSDVSLAKFKAKGGKIIMTHGTADDFITPHNSERTTRARWRSSVRPASTASSSST